MASKDTVTKSNLSQIEPGRKKSAEKGAKADKPAKPAKAEKPVKLAKAEKPEKPAKPDKRAKSDEPRATDDDATALRKALKQMRELVDDVRRENQALAALVKAYAKQNRRYAKRHTRDE